MVFALAGDSTMTSDLAMLFSLILYMVRNLVMLKLTGSMLPVPKRLCCNASGR